MGPQPLRSAEHLRGFPHLAGADKIKVDLANQLYKSAIRILQICMALGCLVSIENPARSWLWALLAILVKDTNDQLFISWFANLESIYFDACAHGSLRDKRTKLLAIQGVFTSLAADCFMATLQERSGRNIPHCSGGGISKHFVQAHGKLRA